MGDYKLKTAADYVVPEAQRVTTEKKRQELLLLRKRVPRITIGDIVIGPFPITWLPKS